jgi:hypothetical protein
MDVRNAGSWEDHTNHYSDEDREMFEELLPTLLSEAARKTSFAKKESKEMMERFEKEFGGAPLIIGEDK